MSGRISGRISGIVRAGGMSRRLGHDKRNLVVAGKPLLTSAVDLVASVAGEIIVSCRRESQPDPELYAGRKVKLVFDEREGGPLAGLEAALRAAAHNMAVVVPVDMPGLTTAMLANLIAASLHSPETAGAVFVDELGASPFPAVYRRSMLSVLSAQLDAGDYRVRTLIGNLDLAIVGPSPAMASRYAFLNLNTAADLELGSER